MRLLIPLFILFMTPMSFANMEFYLSGPIMSEINDMVKGSDKCPNTTNKEEILDIIRQHITTLYPKLIEDYKDDRILIREFESEQYFLKTFFKLGHVLKDKRVYFIDINKKLYECAPTKTALSAIMAHELKHIDDYKNASSVELIKLGVQMLKKKSRSAYERQTDYFVMNHEMSEGIKEYRQWIYQHLSEKGLKTKKCFYFTPEEINRFQQGETDFHDYYSKYCKH